MQFVYGTIISFEYTLSFKKLIIENAGQYPTLTNSKQIQYNLTN